MTTMNTSAAPNPVFQETFADLVGTSNYRGLEIAPQVEIVGNGISGTYPVDVRSVTSRDKSEGAFDPAKPMGLMSDPRPMVDSIGSGSVTLDYFTDAYNIPRVSNLANLGINGEERAIKKLTKLTTDRHAILLGELIGTAASYATGYKADQADLNTSTNLVMGNILTGVQAVLDWANGAIDATDIAIVVNPTIRNLLRKNDDLRNSLPAGTQSQRINNATLASAIADETDGAELVVLSERIVGTGGTEAYAFGDHIAILVRGGRGELSFCQTFTDSGNGVGGDVEDVANRSAAMARVEIGRPGMKDGLQAVAHQYFKVKSDHQKLGYLLYDAAS